VKKTDGQWNVEDAGVFFTAMVNRNFNFIDCTKSGAMSKWVLISMPNLPSKKETDALCKHGSFFLDSGIFGIANAHAKKMNLSHVEALLVKPSEVEGWDKFIKEWKTQVARIKNKCWGYVEIDIGGTDQKNKTRAGLQAEGFNPIPVVHPLTDGWDYFDAMANEYDRLCIGNLVQSNEHVRYEILKTVAERRVGKNVQWIHALGITACPLWFCFPTESCDSSAYANVLRFGGPGLEFSGFQRNDVVDLFSSRAPVEPKNPECRNLVRYVLLDAAQLCESVQVHYQTIQD